MSQQASQNVADAPEMPVSSRRLRVGLYVVAVAVCLLFLGSMIIELAREREHLVSNAHREARSLATTLAADINGIGNSVDLALEYIAAEIEKRGGSVATQGEELDNILSHTLQHLRAVENLLVVDAAGRIVAGTAGSDQELIDISEREYFRHHLTQSENKLYVAPPIKGKINGRNVITMIRPIDGPYGNFGGVAIATFGPSFFEDFAGRLDLGPDSALLLAHKDGTVIAREPSTDAVGTSMGDRPLFATHLWENPSGSYLSPRQSDGEIRITGYRLIESLNAVIAVAVHSGNLLAAWRMEILRHAMVFAVLVAVVGIALTYLLRLVRNHEITRAALAVRHQQSLRRTEQQQAIAWLSQASNTFATEKHFLDRAVDLTRKTLQADFCHIFRKIPSRAGLEVVASSGWSEGRDLPAVYPADRESHEGYSLTAGQTVVSQDYSDEARFLIASSAKQHGAMSGVATPIRLEAGMYGVLAVCSRRANAFDDDSARFLEAIAYTISNFLDRQWATRLREVVLNGMLANICVLNQNGDIVLVNERWRAFAGENGVRNDVNWRGLNYLTICSDVDEEDATSENAAEMLDGLRKVLNGESDEFSMEYPCHSKEELRWFRAIAAPILLDRDRGCVVMHLDITSQRDAERKTREAQRIEALGQLTGGVAHDFNNLLTIILGNADLIAEKLPDNSELLPMVRSVQGAAERAADLTSRLLTFSRRQTLMPKRVSVVTMLTDFVELIQRVFPKNIVTKLTTAPDVDAIEADPGQLENALLNLAINARDAMPDGGVLTLRADVVHSDGGGLPDTLAERGGRFVAIRVADTGTGMSDEIRHKVLEPFFTTKGIGEGTGLGLSMVLGFVTQSGGAMTIESELGRVTIISVIFPVSETASQPDDNHLVEPSTLDKGLKVLLVEDEPLVRDHLTMQLNKLDFLVETAATGAEALAKFDSEFSADLVISDIIMPGGISGYDLAARMRRRDQRLPIILMTGYTNPKITRQLREFDAAIPLVQKPFSLRELTAVIRQVLPHGR